jgi:hypothetical protein
VVSAESAGQLIRFDQGGSKVNKFHDSAPGVELVINILEISAPGVELVINIWASPMDKTY